MLHQNLKPTNLLLTYQQQVLLSDWALESVRAHLAASARQEQPEDIAYLAPEQLRGPGQPASDQYALGLLVYEWLTGGPPFTGSYFRLYEQHCYAAPPSLRARVPGLPPALEAVVLQALAKDPAQRFPDIATFADELARAALPPQEGTEGTPSLLQRLRAAWRRTE
jgi:serine/threonine protein kinase